MTDPGPTKWIEFTRIPDSGAFVECPLCGKKIRDLRMARGSHIAWHQRQDARPTDRSGP